MCINFQFRLFFFPSITYDAIMQAIKERKLLNGTQMPKVKNGKWEDNFYLRNGGNDKSKETMVERSSLFNLISQ